MRSSLQKNDEKRARKNAKDLFIRLQKDFPILK